MSCIMRTVVHAALSISTQHSRPELHASSHQYTCQQTVQAWLHFTGLGCSSTADNAQEHPHDRAYGVWKDGNCEAAGTTCSGALHQGVLTRGRIFCRNVHTEETHVEGNAMTEQLCAVFIPQLMQLHTHVHHSPRDSRPPCSGAPMLARGLSKQGHCQGRCLCQGRNCTGSLHMVGMLDPVSPGGAAGLLVLRGSSCQLHCS